MSAWFLLLVAALALSDASPTHDNNSHDDHADVHHYGHDSHTNYSDDHGHDNAVQHAMEHGGFCWLINHMFHEVWTQMGMGDDHEMEDAYGLQCDEHGNFEPKQCHSVHHEEQWCACVNIYTGKPVPNTMTRGKLLCNEHGKIPMTRCPDGYTYFAEHGHEHCFKYFSEPETWVRAQGICQFDGGNLASIHCPETEHFLQDLSRRDSHKFELTWIGGSNAITPCYWFHIDGTPMIYENFENNHIRNRNDSCLLMNYACSNQFRWGTACCEELHPFICGIELFMSDYYYHH